MDRHDAVIMFAGQGSLQPSLFRGGALGNECRALIDGAGGSDSIELFVLAAALAHFRALSRGSAPPAVLLGHGFGELAALVCAGAFTLEQAAEIARRRAAVLDEHQREAGGLLCVRTSRAIVKALLWFADPLRVAVAAENAPDETVLSGSHAALAAIHERAQARGVAVRWLNARWALHCPYVVGPASIALARQIEDMRTQPLQARVYSPILGRYYADADSLPQCLASHLVQPVAFADAVRSLRAEGAERFVECGALRGLASCVEAIALAAAPIAPASRPGSVVERAMAVGS